MTMKASRIGNVKFVLTIVVVAVASCLVTSCEDVSDLAIDKVAAPVVAEVEDVAPNAVSVTFFELDKSGILDKDIGVVQIPVSGLNIDVFAGATKLGTFTTDMEGTIEVEYEAEKPNEFAGTHKGIDFRIFK